MSSVAIPGQRVEGLSVGSVEVPVVVPALGPLGASWPDHLLAQVQTGWRPGEWDAQAWTFIPQVGSDRTKLWACTRPGCGARVTRTGVCVFCSKEQKRAGWSDAELLQHPRTKLPRTYDNVRNPDCLVTRDGTQCGREQAARGLCAGHYNDFHKAARRQGRDVQDDAALSDWLAAGRSPRPRLWTCVVPGCERERKSDQQDHCIPHLNSYNHARRSDPTLTMADFDKWVAEPYLPAYSLSLVSLPESVRAELLLGMQTFDLERGLKWDAANWRKVYTRIREARVESLLHRPAEDWLAGVEGDSSSHIWRHLLHRLQVEDDRYHLRERPDGVLSSFELGLTYKAKKPNKSIAHRQRDIDFTPVTQPWLRGACLHYVRVAKPHMEDVRRLERVAALFSTHLRETLPDSEDPANLTLGTMDSLVALVNRTWTVEKTQSNYLAGWWKVVDHATNHGLWAEVPRQFKRDPRHKPTGTKSQDPEDENGSALPEAVVKHMSRRLTDIAPRDDERPRNGFTPALRAAQYRALVTVLRDTGRRPSEIVSLKDDAVRLDTDGVSWILVYDNIKAKRLGRRLPIDSTLVEAVGAWQRAKREAGITSTWLFPSSNSTAHHLSTGTLERALEEWLAVTPPLAFPVTHPDGEKRVFDMDSITLYSFRHTYAQRHADAGTAPDTLRDLMDHVSMNTTMGYYRVGWKKKRDAQAKMSAFTMDRHGHSAPIPQSRRGLTEVAVPFGNCTEPANVAAAGHGCPTRFKCVGCDFYRPDPSYIPAIETHIDKMRTEVAFMTAHGSPDYMVEAVRHEIEDYIEVVDQMHTALAALPEAERLEVESQMALLRRARAAEAAGLSLTIEASSPALVPAPDQNHEDA